LLLAAHGLGLGAVWCGIRTGADVSRYLKETLSFPKSTFPIALIAVGYPAEEPKVGDRLDPSRIHYEKW
ncbi:MAG TPA: nitroreductase family protein, partial [Clostridiales bacterium]|nr:nitroreductase family protein [Clostridiales bacterium]